MDSQSNVARRFGPEFVAEYERRYGKRPPEQRQLTYDIAVEEEYASWRRWLDDQLALLPTKAADAIARRVWLDEHFWPVNFELATGAGLRAAGLHVAYEQKWDGLTPDWTVLSDEDKPLAFVEVHTDQPPSSTFGQMRAWHNLVERIKAIPIPVVLQVASQDGGPVPPPDAGTAKKIARDLHDQLAKFPWPTVLFSQSYRFHVMADPRRGGQQRSPLGMHAAFDPPSSRAGAVSAQPMMGQVRAKVHAYAHLANKYDIPLVVAVGAHRFTGVTLQLVDDVLTGLEAPKFTFQFNAGDPYIGKTQTVPWAPIPPWRWPEELSGLLWIENELPFGLVARPNSVARRQMPSETLGMSQSRQFLPAFCMVASTYFNDGRSARVIFGRSGTPASCSMTRCISTGPMAVSHPSSSGVS